MFAAGKMTVYSAPQTPWLDLGRRREESERERKGWERKVPQTKLL